MVRATRSLPVPVSPQISTVTSTPAARRMISPASFIRGLRHRATSRSSLAEAGSSGHMRSDCTIAASAAPSGRSELACFFRITLSPLARAHLLAPRRRQWDRSESWDSFHHPLVATALLNGKATYQNDHFSTTVPKVASYEPGPIHEVRRGSNY